MALDRIGRNAAPVDRLDRGLLCLANTILLRVVTFW